MKTYVLTQDNSTGYTRQKGVMPGDTVAVYIKDCNGIEKRQYHKIVEILDRVTS